MGVGLVRSLQPPDILLIHCITNCRVYNSIANTSRGVLFLPPSDSYVRSYLCLLYTLIKLYYTKALSNQTSSLALDWILLLQRPRILVSFRGSATSFQTQENGTFKTYILVSIALGPASELGRSWCKESLWRWGFITFVINPSLLRIDVLPTTELLSSCRWSFINHSKLVPLGWHSEFKG